MARAARQKNSGAPASPMAVAPVRRWLGFLGPLALIAALTALLMRVEGPPLEATEAALAVEVPELWIDPADGRAARMPSWADPRWPARMEAVLAEAAPFSIADAAERAAGLDRTAAALRSLSFVREVERCEADPLRGLLLVVALRRPVACLAASGGYRLVDEAGVVLEGDWPTPPRLGPFFLPVLGPVGDPVLGAARPGDWLAEPEHLAGLEVVRSLYLHLRPADRARLGRVVIDASEAAQASVDRPGIRLELEGGRVALFGREPDSPEPGELAAEHKWSSLVRALELFEASPEEGDWRLVDLRWDRPELALRQRPGSALEEERHVAAVRPPARPAAHEREVPGRPERFVR